MPAQRIKCWCTPESPMFVHLCEYFRLYTSRIRLIVKGTIDLFNAMRSPLSKGVFHASSSLQKTAVGDSRKKYMDQWNESALSNSIHTWQHKLTIPIYQFTHLLYGSPRLSREGPKRNSGRVGFQEAFTVHHDGMYSTSRPVKYFIYWASYMLFAAITLPGKAAIFLRLLTHSSHRLGLCLLISFFLQSTNSSYRPNSSLVVAYMMIDLFKGMYSSQFAVGWLQVYTAGVVSFTFWEQHQQTMPHLHMTASTLFISGSSL